MIIVTICLTIVVIVLCIIFFFLHARVENLSDRLKVIYSNIDIIHKNQEELLAQNLRMFHEKGKDKKHK